MPSQQKRPAFLSVDCDSQLDYFRAYNLSRGPGFTDRVYAEGLPRLLDIFASVGARATFFLVGREVRKPNNRRVLRRMVEEGHELGNHTLTHLPDLPQRDPATKAFEIDEAHCAIAGATGQEPVGFRAPLYGIDPVTLDLLEERGYLYDSSVFPSAFFCLQQTVARWKAKGRNKVILPGNLMWHFAPKEPYLPDGGTVWRRGKRRIWEVPITVVPGLNLPFYGTFLLWAGTGYFRVAYAMVSRWAKTLVLQYHPMELMTLGKEGIDSRLKMLPNIKRPVPDKEEFIAACLQTMSEHFTLLPGREFLEALGCVAREVA